MKQLKLFLFALLLTTSLFAQEKLSSGSYFQKSLWTLSGSKIVPRDAWTIDATYIDTVANKKFVTDAQLILINTISGKVDTIRTLTINGVTYSLGANRSWTVTADPDSAIFATQNDLTVGLAGKANSLGADDNYVTDAEKIVIGNTSGTNTGDASGHSALAPLASPTFTGTLTVPVGLTGVLRADTGVMSVDTDVTDLVTAATTTASGKIEIAINTEINTGTDATRAVSPDALAGSNFGIRYIAFVLNGTTALTTAEEMYQRIPAAFTGMNLVSVTGSVGTGAAGSSSSGIPTFTVRNVTDAQQMLSTSLTIDANEYSSATAATPVVINTSYDDVATDDLIEIACTVAGTGVTYTVITLGFALP